jgi:hypothetical protein
MDRKSALIAAAIVFGASAHAGAKAQVEPPVPACKQLAGLATAWQNFDTQDVNATLEDVGEVARQVSLALDQAAAEVRPLSPAAFDQLQSAQEGVQAAIDAVPEEATSEQIQDSIASARENERFAYQNLMGNIVCP